MKSFLKFVNEVIIISKIIGLPTMVNTYPKKGSSVRSFKSSDQRSMSTEHRLCSCMS